jgi:hypothetical protein
MTIAVFFLSNTQNLYQKALRRLPQSSISLGFCPYSGSFPCAAKRETALPQKQKVKPLKKNWIAAGVMCMDKLSIFLLQ